MTDLFLAWCVAFTIVHHTHKLVQLAFWIFHRKSEIAKREAEFDKGFHAGFEGGWKHGERYGYIKALADVRAELPTAKAFSREQAS